MRSIDVLTYVRQPVSSVTAIASAECSTRARKRASLASYAARSAFISSRTAAVIVLSSSACGAPVETAQIPDLHYALRGRALRGNGDLPHPFRGFQCVAHSALQPFGC